MTTSNIVTAAAVQISPVFDSATATGDKVCQAISDAAARGAQIVVFPETFVPYYPYFSFVLPPVAAGREHLKLYDYAPTVPGPITDAVAAQAKAHGVVVVLGVNERDHGSLYNTQLIFDETGRLALKRRKITPTYHERMIWGQGFDLLEFDAYAEMSVQFSRGCPFQCEFCDIIVLYGRKPRTKTPAQLLAELDYLYELGWRRSIFMVDDNFIGNKRNVKLFLKELQPWMVAHQYPFSFATEASVDLAQDQELMDAMVRCNFGSVFLGIETPDEESLAFTQKFQNTRDSLSEAVHKITRSGLRVMAGFIIGFDGEKTGAGGRIVKFVEQTSIPTALFSMLQALPDTALWHRLEKENRLRSKSANINQTTLMNFVPTRPLPEIASEYVEAFWELYEPSRFLDRAYRHFRILGEATYPQKGKGAKKPLNWKVLRAFSTICWRQGVLRNTRWQFWRNLWGMYKHNPVGISSYLAVCAQIEHFLEYRQIVRDEIEAQVAEFLKAEATVRLEEERAQVLV